MLQLVTGVHRETSLVWSARTYMDYVNHQQAPQSLAPFMQRRCSSLLILQY